MVALEPEIEPDAANRLSAVQSRIQHAPSKNLGLEQMADASPAFSRNQYPMRGIVISSRVSSPSPYLRHCVCLETSSQNSAKHRVLLVEQDDGTLSCLSGERITCEASSRQHRRGSPVFLSSVPRRSCFETRPRTPAHSGRIRRVRKRLDRSQASKTPTNSPSFGGVLHINSKAAVADGDRPDACRYATGR